MSKMKLIIFLVIIATLLSACNSKIVEEAKKNEIEEENQADKQKEIEYKQKRLLEENEVTIEDALENIEGEKEVKNSLENRIVGEKEVYTDPEEFAQYTSKTLFDFFSGELPAEDYFDFIKNHGSLVLLKDIDFNNRSVIVEGYKDIQKMLKESEANFTEYKISELTIDEPGIYAYFYRTLIQENGEETSYRTTIVNEGQKWKFDSDDLSIGYIEEK